VAPHRATGNQANLLSSFPPVHGLLTVPSVEATLADNPAGVAPTSVTVRKKSANLAGALGVFSLQNFECGPEVCFGSSRLTESPEVVQVRVTYLGKVEVGGSNPAR
jgi:hypothetical protein